MSSDNSKCIFYWYLIKSKSKSTRVSAKGDELWALFLDMRTEIPEYFHMINVKPNMCMWPGLPKFYMAYVSRYVTWAPRVYEEEISVYEKVCIRTQIILQ